MTQLATGLSAVAQQFIDGAEDEREQRRQQEVAEQQSLSNVAQQFIDSVEVEQTAVGGQQAPILGAQDERPAIEAARNDELFQQARQAEIASGQTTNAPLRRFNQIRTESELPPVEALPVELIADTSDRAINALKQAVRGFAETANRAVEGVGDLVDVVTELVGIKFDPPSEFFESSRNVIRAFLPDDPRLRQEFLSSQLPAGLGSAAGFFALGASGGLPGVISGGVTLGAQEQAEAARGANVEGAQKALATTLGGVLGLTETALPLRLMKVLKPVDRAIKGKLFSAILSRGGLPGDVAIEAMQELGQQTGSNLIAKQILKIDRPLTDGLVESGKVGGGVGLIFGGLSRLAGIKLRRFKSPEAQAGAEQGSEAVSAQARVQPTEQTPETSKVAQQAAQLAQAQPEAAQRLIVAADKAVRARGPQGVPSQTDFNAEGVTGLTRDERGEFIQTIREVVGRQRKPKTERKSGDEVAPAKATEEVGKKVENVPAIDRYKQSLDQFLAQDRRQIGSDVDVTAVRRSWQATVGIAIAQGKDVPESVVKELRQMPKFTKEETEAIFRGGKAVEKPPPIAPKPAPAPAVGERSATSIKNAVVDQEREKRGLRPAMEPARRSFGTVWDEAVRSVEEQPAIQDGLIAELASNPRPVSDLEDALLLHRQISVQNEYDKAISRHDQAQKTQDVAATAQAESQQEVLLAELLELYDINKSVGTATARGLNARKMLAAEDFSLVRMVTMKRKARGASQLSVNDTTAVKDAHREIVDLEKQLREHTERITELEADNAFDQKLKDLIAKETKVPRKKRTAEARAGVEAAWKDLESKIEGKLFANPLDPAIVASMAKLAKAHVNLGIAKFEDFVAAVVKRLGKAKAARLGDAMARAWRTVTDQSSPKSKQKLETPQSVSRFAQKLAKFFVSTGVTDRNELVDKVHAELVQEIPELTRRDTMDAISGYGKYSLLSKDAVDARLRDIKGQLQQVAKLEDMQAGRAPLKTGIERRTPSDEERILIQQVNEMKKQGGFDITDPETQLKSSLAAVKTRLRNQIADLERQIDTKERIVKTRIEVPQDAEVQDLAKRRDALKKQLDAIFGKPGASDAQRVRNAIESAKRSIVDLNRRIRERDFGPRRRPSRVQVTRELQSLRDKRDALRSELRELSVLQNPKKTPEQRALWALKTRLRTRIADYQDRLARGDFAPRVRKKTKLDKEAERLRFQVEQAKRGFLEGLVRDARRNRTVVQKVFGLVPESLNTSRAILTSFDLSAVGRQGGNIVFAHPVRSARALGIMFRSFASKVGASRAHNALENRPNAALYRRAKLEITDPEGKLSQQEEEYMSRWSKMIPIVAGSERAFVAFLNRVRADTFDAMVAMKARNGTITEAEAKVIANFVNVATGRGDLGKFRAAAVPLATVFFAPRFVASRFQYLTLQPLRIRGNTAHTRKLIASEYARALVGRAIFYSTAALALSALIGPPGDDEEWNIELDLRSSDFLKIRIGKTRIDPMSGLAQVTVLLARLITGQTKRLTTGEIVPIRGEKVPFGGSTGSDIVARFLRTKLSPAIGTGINIVSGENVIGETTTAKTIARDLVIPISMRDIAVLIREHGVPMGTVLNLLEIFGTSTQHFDDFQKPVAKIPLRDISNPALRERTRKKRAQERANRLAVKFRDEEGVASRVAAMRLFNDDFKKDHPKTLLDSKAYPAARLRFRRAMREAGIR